MKPKYNIWDEVYVTHSFEVFMEEWPSIITWIKDLSFDETWDFHYKINNEDEFYSEKQLSNRQEYITHLKENASELMTLANKLEEDAN